MATALGYETTFATLFARQKVISFGRHISIPAAENASSQLRVESPFHHATVMRADGASSTSAEDFVEARTAKHERMELSPITALAEARSTIAQPSWDERRGMGQAEWI